MIGIDRYGAGLPRLSSAVDDARAIAAHLRYRHGYTVRLLTNERATRRAIEDLVDEPLGSDDRLIVFFAGHGVADDGDSGPAGYLLPVEAQHDVSDTFIPMDWLRRKLGQLQCGHCLAVFDCCFAGAFRWARSRNIALPEGRVYRERYERFIDSDAWQVITSAAHDQRALDRISGSRGERDARHSPFANALIAGLGGAADLNKDGLITASELAIYLRDQVEPLLLDLGHRQTPELSLLDNSRHQYGEYVFHVPGQQLALPRAPNLSEKTNPYRGLASFEPAHQSLYFGRRTAVDALVAHIERRPLTVVTGASGTGKSSLVKAGVIASLEKRSGWRILPVLRIGTAPVDMVASLARLLLGSVPVGTSPFRALEAAERLGHDPAKGRILIVIDQFEELLTAADPGLVRRVLRALADLLCASSRVRLVITVRADTEAAFVDGAVARWWHEGRFSVPAASRQELRETIFGPAEALGMEIDPPDFVERLLDEVASLPVPLPLLSFTLSELYRLYWERRERDCSLDRTLRETDYHRMGAVGAALTKRATQVYDELVATDQEYAEAIRNMMLRMVNAESGDPSRRRIARDALVFETKAENDRVTVALDRFEAARLISRGEAPIDDVKQSYVEPMHDELVRGWALMIDWAHSIRGEHAVLVELGRAAAAWQRHGRPASHSWQSNPRLEIARAILRSPRSPLNAVEAEFVRESHRLRRVQRNRRSFAIAMASTVLVAALMAFAWQRGKADAASRVAQSRRLAIQSTSGLAAQHDLALLLAVGAYDASPTIEAESALLTALAAQPRLVRYLHNDSSDITAVAFSGDGLRVAVGDASGGIKIWDAREWSVVTSWHAHADTRHTEPYFGTEGVSSVSFGADTRTVVTTGADGWVRVWDSTDARQPRHALEIGAVILSASMSPDGQTLVVADFAKTYSQALGAEVNTSHVRAVAVATGKVIKVFPDISGELAPATYATAFSGDGRWLATGGSDHHVRIWSARDWGPAIDLGELHEQPVGALAFAPGGALASAGFDNTIHITPAARWLTPGSAQNQDDERSWKYFEGSTRSLAFSPDGRYLLGGTTGNEFLIWRAENGDQLYVAPRRVTPATRSLGIVVAPSRASAMGISGDSEGLLAVWNLRWGSSVARVLPTDGLPDGEPVVERGVHEMLSTEVPAINAVAWSTNGMLATGSADGHVVVRQRGAIVIKMEVHAHVMKLAFAKDGTLLAVGSSDGTLALYETDTWRKRCSTQAHLATGANPRIDGVEALAFGVDGTIYTSGDGDVGAWSTNNCAARSPNKTRVGVGGDVQGLAVLPQRSRVVAGADNDVMEFEATSLHEIDDREPSAGISALARTGPTTFVTASNDGKVTGWDLTPQLRSTFESRRHQTSVTAIAADETRRRVYSAGDDGRIALWDADSYASIGPMLATTTGAVWDLALSPDGTQLVAVGAAGEARIWDVSPARWRVQACSVANRNLTCEEWRSYFPTDPYVALCTDAPVPECTSSRPVVDKSKKPELPPQPASKRLDAGR